jgi:hypothetical protein
LWVGGKNFVVDYCSRASVLTPTKRVKSWKFALIRAIQRAHRLPRRLDHLPTGCPARCVLAVGHLHSRARATYSAPPRSRSRPTAYPRGSRLVCVLFCPLAKAFGVIFCSESFGARSTMHTRSRLSPLKTPKHAKNSGTICLAIVSRKVIDSSRHWLLRSQS